MKEKKEPQTFGVVIYTCTLINNILNTYMQLNMRYTCTTQLRKHKKHKK